MMAQLRETLNKGKIILRCQMDALPWIRNLLIFTFQTQCSQFLRESEAMTILCILPGRPESVLILTGPHRVVQLQC